jgi:hypothetical protein
MDNGEEHSQDRQEVTAQNRCERQALSLRQVPEAQSEACQNTCTLVLPRLRERKSPCGDPRIRVGLIDFPRPLRKLVIANEQKPRSLAMLLDVFRERITHIGLTGPPQLHFHDLGCQPIAA